MHLGGGVTAARLPLEESGPGSNPGPPALCQKCVFSSDLHAYELVFVCMERHSSPFSEEDLRAAIAQAVCWSDALRFLGYELKGHNFRTVQKWTAHWGISTDHFDPKARTARSAFSRQPPIEQVLVEHSTYKRSTLKRRLIRDGLRLPVCEMCGQGEFWKGNPMSLILDHINGVPNDNRLENLRILCPNCNATLDTHCGRNTPRQRVCPGCKQTFAPSKVQHRYCSDKCWGTIASAQKTGVPQPWLRKVERPSREQLLKELSEMSMVKVGAKYGVSDNAVRKWLRSYESEAARQAADPAGEEATGQDQAA